jgi:hypothetical protein
MSTTLRLALASLLTLWLAACGSAASPSGGSPAGATPTGATGGTSSNDAYATAVCGALNEWTDAMTSTGASLDPSVMTDPQAAQDALVELFTTLAQKTDEAIDTIEAAGAPDIPRGEEVQAAMIDALTVIRDAYQESAEKIQSGDMSGFAQIMDSFSQDLQDRMEGIQQRLDDLASDPDLQASFGEVADCSQP